MASDAKTAAGLSEARRALLKGYLRGGMAGGGGAAAAIPKRQGSDPAPLSYGQQQVWIHSQFAGDSLIYNEPVTIHRHGDLDAAALERSFREVVRRHEAWRTTFEWKGDQLVQIVHPPPSRIEIPLTDLRALPEAEREAEAIRLATEDATMPFDLARGPMYRPRLVRMSDTEHRLYLSLHHIIFDGVSLYRVFLPELQALYDAFSRNEPPQLPDLPVQYPDYAVWHREMIERVLPKELPYWKTVFADLPTLDLKTDHPRPLAQTYVGEMETLIIPVPVANALKAISQEHGVTLFMTVVAAFTALMHGYTGQEDIVIGSVSDTRTHTELQGLIGFFLNTIVIRSQVSGDVPFTEMLTRVKGATLGALSHSTIPFELLVKEFGRERTPGRVPLFQVLISVEPPLIPLKDGWAFTQMDVETGAAKFDLHLELDDRPEGLIGRFIYNTALFERQTIQALKSRWLKLLDEIAASPDRNVRDLTDAAWGTTKSAPAISPPQTTVETDRDGSIPDTWNGTATPYPADRTVHALFREQVRLNPAAVAIDEGGKYLTYAELDRQSDTIAAALIRRGVKPGDAVAIGLPRSARLIAGILGILKTGAAYVPLDPSYPAARIDVMVRESGAKILIGEDEPPPLASPVAWMSIDDTTGSEPPPQELGRSGDAAYIMFTSGSTGVPKGVRVLHRGISRLVINTNYVEFTPADVIAHASNTSFDASTFEIWGALLHAARLVIVPREILLSPRDLAAFIRERKISILFLTTPLFHHFARETPGAFGTLRYLVAGGDALQPEAARTVLQTARPAHLVNGYGPTETTTFAVCHDVSDVPPNAASIPIGHPISNTRAYILDAALKPVPPGVAGELYLGGPGVAGGYLNDPEATAAKFIPDPFSDNPGDRLYKTGDLARWLDGGLIEFLGRADNQVKIRGFRIEPGEIEAALMRHPRVRQAVVATRPDSAGQKQLAAYVVPQPGPPPTLAELRDHLLGSLPKHMAPATYALLDALPLNANGKVDTAALAALPVTGAERAIVEPATWIEASLAEIWEEILRRQPIGVTEDFFELGGHSLLAIRMLAEVEKRTGIRISPKVLFGQAATVRHLAAALTEQRAVQNPLPLVRVQPDGAKPPLFFFHGDFLFGGLYLAYLAKYLPKDRPCYAIEPHGFDGADPPPSIEEMAASRLKTVLEVQPEGPYFLGGFCNGGLVAFEVARLLRAQGREVVCLVLLAANGMNSRFRTLKRLATLVARIRGFDQLDARDLFLRWRRHFLFGGVLIRYHLKELQSDNGTARPRLILGKTISFAKWLLRFVGIRSSSTPAQYCAAPVDPDMENMDRPIWGVYSKAVCSFVPRRYDGKVVLYRETELPPHFSWMSADLGWSKVASDLSIHNIPGGHFTITSHSNIAIFAEHLKVCLEQAEADGVRPSY